MTGRVFVERNEITVEGTWRLEKKGESRAYGARPLAFEATIYRPRGAPTGGAGGAARAATAGRAPLVGAAGGTTRDAMTGWRKPKAVDGRGTKVRAAKPGCRRPMAVEGRGASGAARADGGRPVGLAPFSFAVRSSPPFFIVFDGAWALLSPAGLSTGPDSFDAAGPIGTVRVSPPARSATSCGSATFFCMQPLSIGFANAGFVLVRVPSCGK